MKTIKVKETKLHTKTSVELEGGEYKYVQPYPQVPVVEAKLVLVKCKYEEAIISGYWDNEGHEFLYISKKYDALHGFYQHYKPILISETEVKEEGNQVLSDNHEIFTIDLIRDNSLRKIFFKGGTYCTDKEFDTFYKVLALPEHFSPKLLQDIVDGKLKEGDRVLLECIGTCTNCGESHENSVLCYDTVGLSYDRRIEPFYVKLNSSGHITLHKLEEKMYTEDRVLTLLHWLNNNTYMNGGRLQRYRGFEHTPESLLEYFNTNVK